MFHIDLLDLMVFLTFGVLIIYRGNRYLYLKKNKNIVLSDETCVEQQEKNNEL